MPESVYYTSMIDAITRSQATYEDMIACAAMIAPTSVRFVIGNLRPEISQNAITLWNLLDAGTDDLANRAAQAGIFEDLWRWNADPSRMTSEEVARIALQKVRAFKDSRRGFQMIADDPILHSVIDRSAYHG